MCDNCVCCDNCPETDCGDCPLKDGCGGLEAPVETPDEK
jgi:hypothetical protein